MLIFNLKKTQKQINTYLVKIYHNFDVNLKNDIV